MSDEGAGVWMTLECIRLLIRDIETRGSQDYHSVLLDRLTDFFSIPVEATWHIPSSHRALAKALAALYGRSNPRERAGITKAFDPLHPVVRLL